MTAKKKRVKKASCRSHGSVLSTSKNKKAKSTSAAKLASKTCKTNASLKKSSTKMKALTSKAKKIRKSGESWQNAVKRAAKM